MRIAACLLTLGLALSSCGDDKSQGPSTLPNNIEPSGVVWSEHWQRLFIVHDEGYIFSLDANLEQLTEVAHIGGDLEGITVDPTDPDRIYIGREHPDAIIVYNIKTSALEAVYDLTPWMKSEDNKGLEGLTYHNGVFYAGLEATGEVFAFKLYDGSAHHVETLQTGLESVSGLCYTDALHVLDKHSNSIVRIEGDTHTVFSVPGNAQEGITIVGSAVYIAEDTPPRVVKYEGLLGN